MLNLFTMKRDESRNWLSTLEQFSASSTAHQLNINNQPTKKEIANLKYLNKNILEPLR